MEKNYIPKKRIFGPILIIVLILLLIIFGARLLLIVNKLIGNDVTVSLNIDKENLFLEHNQQESITINSNILANPFCSVYCTYSFTDLGSNNLIESDEFTLKTLIPFYKNFTLTAPSVGQSQNLYRFNIDCQGQKTYLCDTTEEIKSRTALITLNYNLTEEEKEIAENSKQEILNTFEKLEVFKQYLVQFNSSSQLNKAVNIQYLNSLSASANYLISKSNSTAEKCIDLIKKQDFSQLSTETKTLSSQFETASGLFNEINKTVYLNISSYNSVINELNSAQSNLINLQTRNMSESTFQLLNESILEFNNITAIFNQTSLSQKEYLTNRISNKISKISETMQKESSNETVLSLFASEIVNNFTENKIELTIHIKPFNYSIEESGSICCLFEKCDKCCDDSCFDNPDKYPIIFLHGHDFNKKVSADSNINFFNELQNILENDNYLNAGFLFAGSSDSSGALGKINYPLSFSASYYFDILKNPLGIQILETKKDSLDTYAIRLNDLINIAKQKTNRDKVILITHSMGGLVARRYLQIFGQDSVDKLIMIASPNHGISGAVLTYCSVFGSELECREMDENSLFINKLNNGNDPTIPIYNIIGLGCEMDSETGDGIVKESGAYLDFANNIYLNGTCEELLFAFFHSEILDFNKYPQALEIIKQSLNNSEQPLNF